MELFTLSNITAWSLQIALVTIAAAVLSRVLPLDAPVLRHAYWRGVLALCLLLPFVQTWQSAAPIASSVTLDAGPSAGPATPAGATAPAVKPSMAVTWARAVQHFVSTIPPSLVVSALAAGAAIKCLWLLFGVARLRRLRRIALASPRHAPDDSVYDDVSALVQVKADVWRVPGLGQPVTFGIWNPTVLVPDTFDRLPEGVRRAVIAHELWHVRRRDWLWLLGEEVLRAVFWFHPAIVWLVSQVQRSREEVVDELTVLLTNARRTYLETLLLFADASSISPAAPIAARGHLLQRMLLISKEAGMSRHRIMASSVITMLAVAGTATYGFSAFPLMAEAPAVTEAQQGAPPRDRRPTDAAPETSRERALVQVIAQEDSKPSTYIELAELQRQRNANAEAEATLLAARTRFPNTPTVLSALSVHYNIVGNFERTVAMLEEIAALDSANPQRYQLLATFYWEKSFKDQALTREQKAAYIQRGIDATDRALALDPNYVDSLTYKNILLRLQANMEPQRATQLIAEADELRNRAVRLQAAKQTTQQHQPHQPRRDSAAPPPPPPPPPAPGDSDAMAPVRVGGEIKPPKKIKDVKPVYPAEAQNARLQGVVIIEATLDPDGRVVATKVLRGQPLLDQAAVDAVRQWEFEPTQVNGAPASLMMTVTVNFTLDQSY